MLQTVTENVVYGHFPPVSDSDCYFMFKELPPGIYGSLAGELQLWFTFFLYCYLLSDLEVKALKLSQNFFFSKIKMVIFNSHIFWWLIKCLWLYFPFPFFFLRVFKVAFLLREGNNKWNFLKVTPGSRKTTTIHFKNIFHLLLWKNQKVKLRGNKVHTDLKIKPHVPRNGSLNGLLLCFLTCRLGWDFWFYLPGPSLDKWP